MNYSHLKNNTMSSQDWENVDSESREIIKQFIDSLSNFQIIKQTSGKSSYDTLIECTTSGKRILLEIKNRKCKSTTYPTMMCDYDKKTSNTYRISRNEAQHCLLISIYQDGFILIGNINQGFKSSKFAPNQSEIKGAKQYYYNKEVLEIPIEKCQKFEYLKNSSGDYEFWKV